MKKTTRQIDMLNGPLAGKMLLFALPLAATGILQQLFNAADIAVVGQFVGSDAMAAVGANTSVLSLFLNLFIGISLGANVVIATFTGQKNRDGITKAVHTAILIALFGGCALTIIGEILTCPILSLMGVPSEVMDMAVLYLRTYLLGMPVILLYNFESAIFRSQGDTRTPLICLIISGIINVSLNLLFVVVLHRSVDGVALATVLSNLISAFLLFIVLLRTDMPVRISISKLRIDKQILIRILKIGVPAGVQSMVFSLSNVVAQSAINSLGASVMAASTAAFNIEILTFYVITAFSQGCTTFIGQNYGAGKIQRCRRIFGIGLTESMILTAVMMAVILLFPAQLLSIFNSDSEILEYGAIRLWFIMAFYPFNTWNETVSGTMRGYGRSLVPALMALICICGTRIIWILGVFPHVRTFVNLMTAYPISWIVNSVALFIAYVIFMCYLKKKEITSSAG